MKNFIKTSLLSIPLITWNISADTMKSSENFTNKIALIIAKEVCVTTEQIDNKVIDLKDDRTFNINGSEKIIEVDMKWKNSYYDFYINDFELENTGTKLQTRSKVQKNFWLNTSDQVIKEANKHKKEINKKYLQKIKDCKETDKEYKKLFQK